eukprot:gene37584-45652_t
MASDNAGVPIKLLYQGEGHVLTVELKNGEIYRGQLVQAEETMNCQLKDVTMTGRDGRVCKLENVFIRGGHIKFIVLPDLLRVSPVLKKVQALRSSKSDADGGKANKGGMGPNSKKPRKA